MNKEVNPQAAAQRRKLGIAVKGPETQVTSLSFAQCCKQIQLHMRPLALVLFGYINETGGLSWMFYSPFHPLQSGGGEDAVLGVIGKPAAFPVAAYCLCS